MAAFNGRSQNLRSATELPFMKRQFRTPGVSESYAMLNPNDRMAVGGEMATLRQLVRAAVVTALVFAAAVTVGLGSQVPMDIRPRLPLSPSKTIFGDIPGCGYDLLALQNAGYLWGYQVSDATVAIASEKYFFIGQVCPA